MEPADRMMEERRKRTEWSAKRRALGVQESENTIRKRTRERRMKKGRWSRKQLAPRRTDTKHPAE